MRVELEEASGALPLVANSRVKSDRDEYCPPPMIEDARMRHVSKPGRAATCAERGAGQIVHAVDRSGSVYDLNVPALCGAKPGGRLGWTDYAALSPRTPPPPITCPKCLAKLPIG